MSGDTEQHDDDDAGAHDDHGFDGEPAKELGPDEPLTPPWVPALGAAIFVIAAVLFLVSRRGNAAPSTTGAAPAEPQIVASALPSTRVPMPATANAAGTAALQKMSPDQLRDLQRRIQQAGGGKGNPPKKQEHSADDGHGH